MGGQDSSRLFCLLVLAPLGSPCSGPSQRPESGLGGILPSMHMQPREQ